MEGMLPFKTPPGWLVKYLKKSGPQKLYDGKNIVFEFRRPKKYDCRRFLSACGNSSGDIRGYRPAGVNHAHSRTSLHTLTPLCRCLCCRPRMGSTPSRGGAPSRLVSRPQV